MRCVRHKLTLLIPCLLHRAHCPLCQHKADAKKDQKARQAHQSAGLQQTAQRGLFAGNIRKDGELTQRRGAHTIAQTVRLHHAGLLTVRFHSLHQFAQKLRIRQIIVAVAARTQLPVLLLNGEVGEQHVVAAANGTVHRLRTVGKTHVIRLGHDRLHHLNALLLQILLGGKKDKAENNQQYGGDDRHIDEHKFCPELFNHR